MKVELIASTALLPGRATGNLATEQWLPQHEAEDADHLAEFAGRACYQSFHRPNPATERNADYLRNVISKGHESILEHASATFYITGVSRSLTHELIRHRHLSVSELSQRYVDVSDIGLVMPPAFRDHMNDTEDDWSAVWEDWAGGYSADTETLAGMGLPRKRAREAARWQLPNATETRIVVTGNMRAWRHVLRLRGSEAADAEFRELAVELFNQLYDLAPNTFGDMSLTTLADGREVIE